MAKLLESLLDWYMSVRTDNPRSLLKLLSQIKVTKTKILRLFHSKHGTVGDKRFFGEPWIWRFQCHHQWPWGHNEGRTQFQREMESSQGAWHSRLRRRWPPFIWLICVSTVDIGIGDVYRKSGDEVIRILKKYGFRVVSRVAYHGRDEYDLGIPCIKTTLVKETEDSI